MGEGPLGVVLDGLMAPRALKHFGVDTRGVTLRATDLDWSSAEGDGRPVAAPATDLVLLLAGRRVDPDRFEGDPAPLAAGARR